MKKNNIEKKKSEKRKIVKFVKRKYNVPSVTEHDVEKHLTDILDDIEEQKYIDECVAKRAKVVKMLIVGKKLHKSIPYVPLDNVSFHSKESVVMWKFVYNQRLAPEREVFVNS